MLSSGAVPFLLKIALGWGLMLAYLWWRFIRAPRLPRWLGTALGLGLAAVSLAMFFTIRRGASIIQGFTPIGYIWMGLSFILFWCAALFHLVELLVTAAARLRSAPLDPERRVTLARLLGGGAAAAGLAAAAAGAVEARDLVTQRVRVALPKLPPGLDGLRIVQISDLHIGRSIHADYVASIVERANALTPDIVAITGDLVDGGIAALRQHVAPIAALRARFGVFFVTGNHEYYSGVTAAWLEHLRSLGVRVLANERVAIEGPDGGIDLAGVYDVSSGHYGIGHEHDPDRALAGRDPGREVVLLAHQPRSVRDAARLGVGLQLSGHTHGGQIFPLGYFLFDQPFIAGLHRTGDTQIYVSRGAGYWGPPMRVGAPPEIALIELTRAASSPTG
jgi:predicted MPP superfamily phosphohydrolase